jgi:hypothetical protein
LKRQVANAIRDSGISTTTTDFTVLFLNHAIYDTRPGEAGIGFGVGRGCVLGLPKLGELVKELHGLFRVTTDEKVRIVLLFCGQELYVEDPKPALLELVQAFGGPARCWAIGKGNAIQVQSRTVVEGMTRGSPADLYQITSLVDALLKGVSTVDGIERGANEKLRALRNAGITLAEKVLDILGEAKRARNAQQRGLGLCDESGPSEEESGPCDEGTGACDESGWCEVRVDERTIGAVPGAGPECDPPSPSMTVPVDPLLDYCTRGELHMEGVLTQFLEMGEWIHVDSDSLEGEGRPLLVLSQMNAVRMQAIVDRVDISFGTVLAAEEQSLAAAVAAAGAQRIPEDPPQRGMWGAASPSVVKRGKEQEEVSMMSIQRSVESAAFAVRAAHPIAVDLYQFPPRSVILRFVEIITKVTGASGLPMSVFSTVGILARMAVADQASQAKFERDFEEALRATMSRRADAG